MIQKNHMKFGCYSEHKRSLRPQVQVICLLERKCFDYAQHDNSRLTFFNKTFSLR